MNPVFASSHLPEDNRPLEDEEDDDVQPMLRAGGVRAFSHLQQPAQGEPAAPRPTAPDYIPAWITAALRAEHQPGLGTGPGSQGGFESHAIAHGGDGVTGLHAPSHPLTLLNSRPSDPRGGMRPEPAAQQAQPLSAGQGRFSGSPGLPSADTPPETSARGMSEGQHGDTWGDRPPPTRPDPSPSATGRGFDGRGTPGALLPQQGMQLFQAAAPARQKPGGAAPGGAAAPQNAGAGAAPQGGGSLAKYRQQRQALLEQLGPDKKPSPKTIQEIKTKIAAITRSMESIELAAHLINYTKPEGEDAIDPESIDEDSEGFKKRAKDAITQLHADPNPPDPEHPGTAPWLDHLAENFGEREGTPEGGENKRIKDLFRRVGVGDKKTTKEPWCGHALKDAMLEKKIAPPDGAGWAGSWRGWGTESGPKANGPNVGDVYHIRYADGTGHVSTVVGTSKDGTQVFCLGGNQNGGLNVSAYPTGEFNDPKKPHQGKYKDSTTVFKKPPGQHNTIPAPAFDYHADPATFDFLAPVTR